MVRALNNAPDAIVFCIVSVKEIVVIIDSAGHHAACELVMFSIMLVLR